jgi:hypothetical protein
MATYGDGRLRGILSIDVASCFRPDDDGVRLVDARSRQEVLEHVWRQFLDGVDRATRRALARARFAAHLDDEVDVGPAGVSNAARLMVHPPGSRQRRPESVTGLGNHFLAADYVRTFTDLASMEGANEAGRRAARGGARGRGRAGVRVPGDQPVSDDAGARRTAPLGGARALLRLGRGGPARVHAGRRGGSPAARSLTRPRRIACSSRPSVAQLKVSFRRLRAATCSPASIVTSWRHTGLAGIK